jgi:pimeloyl-ACP methyl ester carboxylesterase
VDIQKILSALPDSMYAQVADAGHLIPMQKPSQVIKIIKEFFLKIKGRA